MSLTCVHSVADARRHPECPGCRAISNSEVRAAQRWDAMSDNERRGALYRISLRRVQGQIDEVVRLGGGHRLLESHDPDAERAAFDEQERLGTWFGDPHADGRELTQDETDMLVRTELFRAASIEEAVSEEFRGIIGDPQLLTLTTSPHLTGAQSTGHQSRATQQRGGICSDPLVRVLAWRAWGDRDRGWFEQRGVRAGDEVYTVMSDGTFWASKSWPGEHVRGVAEQNARPGQRIEIGDRPWRAAFRVSDRMREPTLDPVRQQHADYVAAVQRPRI